MPSRIRMNLIVSLLIRCGALRHRTERGLGPYQDRIIFSRDLANGCPITIHVRSHRPGSIRFNHIRLHQDHARHCGRAGLLEQIAQLNDVAIAIGRSYI
jgi:hypothetical protein